MATETIAEPGTKYGPCKKECKHIDCALMQKMAATSCTVCLEVIGYNEPFYEHADKTLVHALCITAE